MTRVKFFKVDNSYLLLALNAAFSYIYLILGDILLGGGDLVAIDKL